MHSYSIDRDLRVRVAVYIFIISIVISVILNDYCADIIENFMVVLENGKAGNVLKVLEWLEVNQNILGVSFWYGILTWFYNDVAWKWKCFKALHGIPDLSGEWEGNLKSSFNDKDEITLPGLGVFFGLVWSKSSDEERNKILNILGILQYQI